MSAARRPLVSVLVPTFNRSVYLGQCLDSLQVQDFTDYELFIRDNASTDGTPAVVERFRPAFAGVAGYRYRRNPANVGFRDNMVEGLKECAGKYVLILMDDDFLLCRTALRSFAEALEHSPRTALAIADYQEYQEGEEAETVRERVARGRTRETPAPFTPVPGKDLFLNAWTRYRPLCLSAAMFDREALRASPWETWTGRAALDVNLYHALAVTHDAALIPEPLVGYRQHGTNDYLNVPLEDCLDSHRCIRKWHAYARAETDWSRLSLWVWYLKTIALKEEGPLRWLHDQDPGKLAEFLDWLRAYHRLHYRVVRWLSPQMARYDYAALAGEPNPLRRGLRRVGLKLRGGLRRLLLGVDRRLHDRARGRPAPSAPAPSAPSPRGLVEGKP